MAARARAVPRRRALRDCQSIRRVASVYGEGVESAARGVGDVPVRVGLPVEGVYPGSLGDVVRHENGFPGLLEAVELVHGPSDLAGGLAAVTVVEEVFLADAAHGLHVVGVTGELFSVLYEDLEVWVVLCGVAGDILDEVDHLVLDRDVGLPQLSAPRRVDEEPVGFRRAGQEEQDEEHRAERYQSTGRCPSPADVQAFFYGDGGDVGAVGNGEEGTEGYPEDEAYTGGVA